MSTSNQTLSFKWTSELLIIFKYHYFIQQLTLFLIQLGYSDRMRIIYLLCYQDVYSTIHNFYHFKYFFNKGKGLKYLGEMFVTYPKVSCNIN